jgi:hypothetical protein
MEENSSLSKNSKTSAVIFALSILMFAHYCVAQTIDVYRIAFIGAIFEFFSLPMLAAIFVLPILSLVFWRQKRFNVRSFYFHSLILSVGTILFLVISILRNPPSLM